MSPKLLKVVERAGTEPKGRFHTLAHLIDVPALERAYRRAGKDAALGVDGVTKDAYREMANWLARREQRLLPPVQSAAGGAYTSTAPRPRQLASTLVPHRCGAPT